MMCDKDGNDLEHARLLEIERKYEAALKVAEKGLADQQAHGEYAMLGILTAYRMVIAALKGGS